MAPWRAALSRGGQRKWLSRLHLGRRSVAKGSVSLYLVYCLSTIYLLFPFFPLFFPFCSLFIPFFFFPFFPSNIYFIYLLLLPTSPIPFLFNWYKIYPLNPSYFGKDPPALLFPCVCWLFVLCFICVLVHRRLGLGFWDSSTFIPIFIFILLFYFTLFCFPIHLSIYCLVGVRSGMAAQQGMRGRNWQQHEEVWGGRKGGCGCGNPGGWGSGAERREGETSK